eukprot:TRINITY_DN6675_c0_g1_i1.p1 TRINITY_DN6675_c0_g1~~TRINITY_DN6675_c0_g1_i1.p1  ORF type:complete len:183 (-),score=11.22 TRINITY_DN6675_c0_g1_i1:5-553(-)
MDKKTARKLKEAKICELKKYICSIPEIKTETYTDEETDASVRLDNFISASMNPRSLIQRLTVKDGFGATMFKKIFHSPLSASLQNEVKYSLHKNRRKLAQTDYMLITTYNCFETSVIRRFLPTLATGRVGLDADLTALVTVLNTNIPIVIKYNWHIQEIVILFEVDKWRGNFVDGQFVGNML